MSLPPGYWDTDRVRSILDKTLTVTLDPDLSGLDAPAQRAIARLLAAGALFHRLYERQKHSQAEAALEDLLKLDRSLDSPPATQDLLTLYRIFKGPVATTLDNQREPFLPVYGERPGRNVYPADIERSQLETFLEDHPEVAREILHPWSVVRRASAENSARDLAALDRRPELEALHPGLWRRLEKVTGRGGFYGIPYSLAYGEELQEISGLLWQAADDIESASPDFAAFLRHRGRDLLVDDNEAGDAAWVRGDHGDLNAQIGAYETYDDELMGVKTFMSMSLLMRDHQRTVELSASLAGIQEIEDSLPHDGQRRVQDRLPVGIYQVIADFGQARGANTATILPNDADVARKYGRVILMRHNLLTHPTLFELVQNKFQTATVPAVHDHLTLDGNFQRILWHEIGHYLGVDRCADGRDLDTALGPYASLCEELKADLASLFSARALNRRGTFDDRTLRSIYASGVMRVLQTVKPRPEQPYQSMQLMQWNFFLDRGVLQFDPATGRLNIDYARIGDAVTDLLGQILAIQAAGDQQRAIELIERWSAWRSDLHEVVARRLREASTYRFVEVRYAAIDGA